MLIEFTVSNFRSIREEVVLSMVAAPRLHKKENVLLPTIRGNKKSIPLLKVAAIYGPNASGKSNLLKALEVVSTIARRNPSETDTPLPVQPFKFDAELASQPTKIEMHFISNETRYQFNLELTENEIVKEQLIEYFGSKADVLYTRDSTAADEYKFSKKLEGGSVVHNAWKSLTNRKTLFISQAVANSHETLEQLRHPYKFINRIGYSIDSSMNLFWAEASFGLAKNSESLNKRLVNFLQDFDIPIKNIIVREEAKKKATNGNVDLYDSSGVSFLHKSALGDAEIKFDDQSEGTKNLAGFWLPWSAIQTKAEEARNKVLIVDEIDSSLHPEIVAQLIKYHINSDGEVQLIFSTHDTHLMSTKLLRRDQLWVTQRDENGATSISSLHDFEGRDSEDIEKRYFENRYSGLPFFPSTTGKILFKEQQEPEQSE